MKFLRLGKAWLLAGLILAASLPCPAQFLPGDLNLDGRVNFADALINLQAWGFTGSRERFFEMTAHWSEETAYPPAENTLSRTFDKGNVGNTADDQLVYVSPNGVAHLYWLARDGESRVQLFTDTVLSWGQSPHPARQLTFGHGIHNFGGIRLAAPHAPGEDYYVVYRGGSGSITDRIVLNRFNHRGLPESRDIIASERIENLDAVDAAVDVDGNLHIAAMARAEFLDSTRTVTYQKVDPLGNPLTDRMVLGQRPFGGGSAQLGHPEVCVVNDRDALVLWDLGENAATQVRRVDGVTGQTEPTGSFPGAFVEPECYWVSGVGVAIGYMQGFFPTNTDVREVFFTVLDENTLTPLFEPIRLSPGTSNQSDGAQLARVGDDFYVSWREFGDRPHVARVTTSGGVVGNVGVGDPGEFSFSELVYPGVDSNGSVHLVFSVEVDTQQQNLHYEKLRIGGAP